MNRVFLAIKEWFNSTYPNSNYSGWGDWNCINIDPPAPETNKTRKN